MLKNIIALFCCLLILALFGLAGSSDRADARRLPNYHNTQDVTDHAAAGLN